MPEVSFDVTADEAETIRLIAGCAVDLARVQRVRYTLMEAIMDLTACHANGCRLDLDKLLSWSVIHHMVGDFGHDIFGIRQHIDRNTGRLGDCFVPRCARR